MSSTIPEPELVFYARLDSFEGLKEAELIENHVQMESTYITGPRGRVRKITPIKGGPTGAADRYEYTMKVKTPPVEGVPSSDETTIEANRDMFVQFAYAATRGMNKDRHRFVGKKPSAEGATEETPIPSFMYEFDVFYTKNRTYSAYIKIDVEVDAIINALRAHNLPIPDFKSQIDFSELNLPLQDVFYGDDATPEQNSLLDKLWQEEWVTEMNPEIYKKPEAPAPIEPVDPNASTPEVNAEAAVEGEAPITEPAVPAPEAQPTPSETPPVEGKKPEETTEPESQAKPEGGEPKENEADKPTPQKPEGEDNE